MRGFIVVLVNPKDFLTTEDNPTYRGVDRLPPYSHKIPEESEAIDEYVFEQYLRWKRHRSCCSCFDIRDANSKSSTMKPWTRTQGIVLGMPCGFWGST